MYTRQITGKIITSFHSRTNMLLTPIRAGSYGEVDCSAGGEDVIVLRGTLRTPVAAMRRTTVLRHILVLILPTEIILKLFHQSNVLNLLVCSQGNKVCNKKESPRYIENLLCPIPRRPTHHKNTTHPICQPKPRIHFFLVDDEAACFAASRHFGMNGARDDACIITSDAFVVLWQMGLRQGSKLCKDSLNLGQLTNGVCLVLFHPWTWPLQLKLLEENPWKGR